MRWCNGYWTPLQPINWDAYWLPHQECDALQWLVSAENRQNLRMKHLEAKKFVYKVRGDCQASIVETDDGSFYILKLAGENRPNLLFNEAFGAQLIRYFRLPVADWAPVNLTSDFIDSNSELWPTEGGYRGKPQQGLHFGSRLVTPRRGIGAFQIIPSSWLPRVINAGDFARILAIDLWTNHCDRRQAIFAASGANLHATFIDNGNMFGGTDGKDSTCPRRTLMHDLRMYRTLPVEKTLEEWRHKICKVSEHTLRSFLEVIPSPWYSSEMADRVVTELLSRRAKLASLYAEAIEVLRADPGAAFHQFVCSIESRA